MVYAHCLIPTSFQFNSQPNLTKLFLALNFGFLSFEKKKINKYKYQGVTC